MSIPIEKISAWTSLHPVVAEAQSRVCTGPNQSRPLGVKESDPDPKQILLILGGSLNGDLPDSEAASRAQIGAFLSAMTLRRNFPPATAWSDAETRAFQRYGADLEQADDAVRFLLNPAISVDHFCDTDRTLAEHLRLILQGNHLSYEHTRLILEAVTSETGDPALKAAVLIVQRMNHETYDEFSAYLDAVIPTDRVRHVNTPTLTTIGEPYNGSTRYFKPTCFVAATRAALGRPTLLHGVDSAPPKNGVTEEQILRALGANTRLSVPAAGATLEDSNVGFAYVSQREFAPHTYAMLDLRAHIVKRPSWAASEKAQMILKSEGRNDMVVGYFHPGYEEKQLRAMRERGLDAGCVIRGEEGTSQLALRSGAPSVNRKKTLNYVEGFRGPESFCTDIEPSDYGFDYDQSPRPDEVNSAAFARSGYEALDGQPGHVQDRIIMNTGLIDWILGYESDAETAIDRAREAVLDGSAKDRLDRYVEASKMGRS